VSKRRVSLGKKECCLAKVRFPYQLATIAAYISKTDISYKEKERELTS